MILVKFLVNLDDPDSLEFQQFIDKNNYETVNYEIYDTGSAKYLRKAKSYFSRYASSKTFIVIEDDEKEEPVIDVIYKESVNDKNSWSSLLKNKLRKILSK